MTDEIYIQIKDFPNYSVSNLGNVKSNRTSKVLKQVLSGYGYYMVKLNDKTNKKTKYIHKLVAEAFLINNEGKPYVDHINNDKSDNKVTNLRFATHKENGQNRQINKNNTSGVKGVYKSGNKWRSQIKIDGILLHLGMYETIEEAKQARQDAVKKAFGEFTNACELM